MTEPWNDFPLILSASFRHHLGPSGHALSAFVMRFQVPFEWRSTNACQKSTATSQPLCLHVASAKAR